MTTVAEDAVNVNNKEGVFDKTELAFFYAGYHELCVADRCLLVELSKWCKSKTARVLRHNNQRWGWRSCRRLAKDYPYLGTYQAILNSYNRLAKAGLILTDASGNLNTAPYDFTINFHVPDSVSRKVLNHHQHRSFRKAEAAEDGSSILIAALRQNIRNQKDDKGQPINCLISSNGKIYHLMSQTILGNLMGVDAATIKRALKHGGFEKYASKKGYYRLQEKKGQMLTPLSFESNHEGQMLTGLGANVDDNTVSNFEESNVESTSYEVVSQPAPSATVEHVQTNKEPELSEKQIFAHEVFNKSINEGKQLLAHRLAIGKGTVDYSNLNNPDCDCTGELTDYEPMNLEQKISMVKDYIKIETSAHPLFQFTYNKDSLNELRKFFCCNPQIDDEFIPHLIGKCYIIQQVQQKETVEPQEGLVIGDLEITQFADEIKSYDAYRWLRQCHNLGFLMEYLEQIFEQAYYYKFLIYTDDGGMAKDYWAIPTVYYWDNRNLHLDLNGKPQACIINRVFLEWCHKANRKEKAEKKSKSYKRCGRRREHRIKWAV